MTSLDDLPITDAREVAAFLDGVPLAIDRESFTRFALGFPHRYLRATSPVEVLKHFALVGCLGERAAISALSGEGERWKLVVVAHDRRALFARIAGSLSLFGANILEAEAIANTEGIVLDVFAVRDLGGRFRQAEERRRFQVLLENVVAGGVDLEKELRAANAPSAPEPLLTASWHPGSPTSSVLRVEGRDSTGLLYRLARRIAEAGCDIDLARIATPGGEVKDEFYLSSSGKPLTPEQMQSITAGLGAA